MGMLLGEIFERESRTKPNDCNGAGGEISDRTISRALKKIGFTSFEFKIQNSKFKMKKNAFELVNSGYKPPLIVF
jgi:hypothetical protein